MRGILVLIIIFGSVPFILAKPHVGVLVWTWISYMNPHKYAFGLVQSFPVAEIVGVTTLVAFVFSRESKRIPWNAITVVMVIFVLWMCLTTLFAVVPEAAYAKWESVMKIMLMTFVAMILINSQQRLNAFIWVIVVSLAFYGVKGGIFAIATGGEALVLGPPNSFLAANNGLAHALIMMLPLMRYLQLEARNKILYWALGASMMLCSVAIAASYSRGALVAGVCMIFLLWLKSRKRLLLGAFAAIAIFGTSMIMPDRWFERMGTIQTYEEDKSAATRIKMWTVAYRIALDKPIVGGGFDVFDAFYLYKRHGVELDKARAVHSNYFEVLGEHGFVGLYIYLLLGFITFRSGSKIIRITRQHAELSWARSLAAMLQTAIVGYAVGGLFLNKAYFDLYYSLVAAMAITLILVQRAVAEKKSALDAVPAAETGIATAGLGPPLLGAAGAVALEHPGNPGATKID